MRQTSQEGLEKSRGTRFRKSGMWLAGVILPAGLLAAVTIFWLQRSFDHYLEPTPRPEVYGPVGAEPYDRLLSAAAGVEMSGSDLADRAAAQCLVLEEQMNRAAEKLKPGQGWREVFSELRRDHPQDAERVLDAYREEIARAGEAVKALDLLTLPSAPVTVTEIQNPIFQRYFSLAMYLDGDLAVTVRPVSVDSDELDRERIEQDRLYLENHCRVCIPPLAIHEIYPGHHVAFEKVKQSIATQSGRLVANRRQTTYHEGWGLYAEHLMLEQGYYSQPDRRLGALRMLYLRALRARMDPLLHRGELTAEQVEQRYREDALMTPAAAHAELERHLKDPVLKASYFIGLHQILKLRELWQAQHPEAPLKQFHDEFLGRPRPIPEVANEAFGLTLERPL